MTAPLSRRVQAGTVSATVAMSLRASEMRWRGERVLDLTVGEPDQPTPPHIKAAAVTALQRDETRYTPVLGLNTLRAAVASRYVTDHGLRATPENVAVTNGGKHALALAYEALLDPDDEVVIPSPCWPTFVEAARLAGGLPVLADLSPDGGFHVTADAVEAAIGPRTRAILINSPCNPTGAVVAPDELMRIGELAHGHGAFLLYDDTYARLSFGRPAPLRLLQELMHGQLVVLGTASKSYCMTGWRIGWILGDPDLVQAAGMLVSHSTQCPTTFAQLGAVEALTGDQEVVVRLCAEYRRRRDLMLPLLRAIPDLRCDEPEGGFYFFPDVSAFLDARARDTEALALQLLDEQRLATVPGEGFGRAGHLRLSFARPEPELRDAVARLGAFLASRGGAT